MAAAVELTPAPALNGPLAVDIEYCSSCGFHADAIELRTAVTQAYGNQVDVRLTAGRPTSFEITAGGQKIYSKLETGDFPDHKQVVQDIGKLIPNRGTSNLAETALDGTTPKPPQTAALSQHAVASSHAAPAAQSKDNVIGSSPYGRTFVGPEAVANRATVVPRNLLPLWMRFPLFYFPYNVDDNVGRCVAFLNCALAIVVAVCFRYWWAQWICAFLCADFFLRVVYGGNGSLLGTMGGWVGHFLPHRVYPGPPKQFAQICGFMFTGGATIAFWTGGAGEGGQIAACVIMSVLAALSGLEAIVGFCAGCFCFKIAVNLGLLGVDPSAKCDLVAEEFDATWTWIKQRLNEGPTTPVIKYAPDDAEDRHLPLIYKVKTDDQRKENFNLIKHVNFSYFMIPVALVGLAGCFRVAYLGPQDTDFGIPNSTWVGLTIFAVIVFGLVLLLLVAKFAVYPRKFWKDWDHPHHSNAVAGFSLCVALFGVICDNWSKSNFVPALFWISCSTQTFLTVVMVGRWIQRLLYKSLMTPMFFMTPVSALVVALLSPVVSAEFGYLWFATGIIFWIILLPMTLQRIIFGAGVPFEQRSSLFMYIACPSVACITWLTLTGNPDITGTMDPVALTLFYFGLLNIFLMGGLVITGYFGRNAFDVSYWAFCFPLEAFTLSAIYYYRRNDTSWTRFMAVAGLLGVSYQCAILGAHTVLSFIKRTGLFVPESKIKGPAGLGQMMHYSFRAALKDMKSLTTRFPASLNEFAETWAVFDMFHSEHARVEDSIIFPQFEQFAPNYSMPGMDQHAAGHVRYEQMNTILKAVAPNAFIKALQQARLPVPQELEKAQAIAPTESMLQDIRTLITDIAVAENAHMDWEEQQMQAIGRKYFNLKMSKALWKDVWNATPVNKWRVFIPFVINNQEYHIRRIMFLQGWMQIIPEKMHLIGQWIYEGCDELMWNRLSVDFPEMIPRHVERHVHYY